jgi:hypothetical protein
VDRDGEGFCSAVAAFSCELQTLLMRLFVDSFSAGINRAVRLNVTLIATP